MNRIRLALLSLLLAACPLWAFPNGPPKKASIPLVIAGDTQVVVKTLPCTVTAPAGADFYFWNLPDGVKGTAEEGALTVTAAPSGDSTITVTAITFTITVGKDGMVTKTKKSDQGTVVLTNGYVPPPPPTPADPLTAAFQTAYNTDTDADRAKSLAFLQGVYKGLPDAAQKRPDLKTVADYAAWIKTTVAVGLQPTQVKSLRTAIGAEFAKSWGTANVPLANVDATAELIRVSQALAGVK